jgi:hypothetical protein
MKPYNDLESSRKLKFRQEEIGQTTKGGILPEDPGIEDVSKSPF